MVKSQKSHWKRILPPVVRATRAEYRYDLPTYVHCEAYLGSEDGLSIGWEFRDPESCGAQTFWLYTMKSGMVLPLCQYHAERYAGDSQKLEQR